jgi:titin
MASAATFTVTNAADTGAGSLRQAITSANALSGADDVKFDIPGAGSHTIAVTSAPLPIVTGRLKIDGATQPGFAGIALVRIDDNTGGGFTTGLEITAGQSQVLSLSITGFHIGILLRDNDTNMVSGNRIGLLPSGGADGNATGVAIRDGSKSNVVGGTTAAARNVISANGEGVVVDDPGATANKVQGNFIGVAPNGATAMGNTAAGISIGAANNTIGGTATGAGNVISGNGGGGVAITGAIANGNVVAGNRIGTNLAGTAAVPNSAFGVRVVAAGNTIGGTTAAARNIISGNAQIGVYVIGPTTTGNVVAGNFIGTTANGAAALPNGTGVVVANEADDNTIGGNRSTSRNVISGNTNTGVSINDQGTTGNVVAGNDIGPNLAGTAALPNQTGVIVTEADGNTIGGTSAARRNVISGNTFRGVDLSFFDTTNNRISANFIGTAPSGTAAMANGDTGVNVTFRADANTIGGATSGERNVISGNAGQGVAVQGATNVVSGNYIGTTANGTDPLGNGGFGASVLGPDATSNRVGGTTSAQRNVISANGTGGIAIIQRATGTLVQGNYIGTAPNGSSPLGNAGPGVALNTSANNSTIGGTASGTGNVIAFNTGDGVVVNGSPNSTSGEAILRNAIFDNGLLGIALLNGGNDAQAAPVITSVTTTATETTIKGTLGGGPASSPFRIETFANGACDPSGAGEGQRLLGAKALTTNGAGNGTFSLKVGPQAPGQQITATATPGSAPLNTSQFSVCFPAP